MRTINKKVLSIITAICLLISTVALAAANILESTLAAQTDDDFAYRISGDFVTITRYLGNDTNVTVPSSLAGLPVIAIGNECFGRGIKSVSLPDSIVLIGASAFSVCEMLSEIILPKNLVELGRGAFSSCRQLVSIAIPKSTVRIGEEAFVGCESLTSISVDPNNPAYADKEGVLFNKEGTELIHYPAGNSRSSYSIPDGVISINSSAFNNNVHFRGFSPFLCLSELFVPESVVRIGSNHSSIHGEFFQIDTLESIHVAPNNPMYSSEDGVLFNKDRSVLLRYPEARTASHYDIPSSVNSLNCYAFLGNLNLSSVTIPGGIYRIQGYAFNGLNLERVEIEDGVRSIGSGAFWGCEKLNSIAIPSSVLYIEREAFEGCESLSNITIPDSVINIEEDAFQRTAWLRNQPEGIVYAGRVAYTYKGIPTAALSLAEGTISIANNNMYGETHHYNDIECNDFGAFTSFPDSLKYINRNNKYTSWYTSWYQAQPDGIVYGGRIALGYKGIMPSNTKLALAEGTVSIGKEAFAGFTTLTEIVVPESVTHIGEGAFRGCTSLENVVLPSSITTIESGAFEGCKSLKSIALPESLYQINDALFAECINLENVQIPNGVRRISTTGTFRTCRKLKTLTLPDSVIFIGNTYFGEEGICGFDEGINAINVSPNNPLYCSEDGVLYNKDKTVLFYYPLNKEGNTFETPNSVVAVGTGAFVHNRNLESVSISNGAKCVVDFAFDNNPDVSLMNISIPDSLLYFDRHVAFHPKLVNVVVGDANPVYSSVDGVLFNKGKTRLLYHPPTI